MMSRCFNKNYNVYQYYGAKGITVCEWIKETPVHLVCLIGERPSVDHSLDRIRNHGHYSCGKCHQCLQNKWPMNVRWATRHEQGANRDTTVFLTIKGETRCVSEWARLSGVEKSTIFQRFKRGWVGAALISPAGDENRYVTLRGETKPMKEWAAMAGITPEAFGLRIKRGWTEEQLLLPKQQPRQVHVYYT